LCKHLVLCGAGHAHLAAIAAIPRFISLGHAFTVISADSYHYYSGMGPGMLAGVYLPREIRFNVKKMTEDRGGKFVEDRALALDAQRRLITLERYGVVGYDVASFNVGSEIVTAGIDMSRKSVITIKPIRNLEIARRRIHELVDRRVPHLLRIAVIGGGAAGVEAAGNAWRCVQEMGGEARVTLFGRGSLLRRFPPIARNKALVSMTSRGIDVLENIAVKANTEDMIFLGDGRQIAFDLAILATGTKPSDLFTRSGIPTGPDGGMLVNRFLQSVRYPDLFGGGDCISFQPHPLERVGVYPVRESPILVHNLEAALSGRAMRGFKPQDSYLQLLNLGDGTAVHNRKMPLSGTRYAFRLKEHIDREFMHKFQLSGELKEAE